MSATHPQSMTFRPLTAEERQQLPPREQWTETGEYHSVSELADFLRDMDELDRYEESARMIREVREAEDE
jgi:hypothetical protein